MPHKHLFTPENIRFIRRKARRHTYPEVTTLLNEKYGTNFKIYQVQYACQKHGIKIGIIQPFCPSKPVGSKYICKKGYVKFKGSDGQWRLAHHALWEKHYGPVPADSMIIFLDGDKSNITIDNLALVTKKEWGILLGRKLRSDNRDMNKLAIITAKLIVATGKKQKAVSEEYSDA